MVSVRDYHSGWQLNEVTTNLRTVVFWGAGATASLGMHTTAGQGQSLRELAPRPDGKEDLQNRVRNALGDDVADQWVSALCDLLKILGDRDEAINALSVADIYPEQLEAMERNWEGKGEDSLRKRIVELRSLYDWPALVAAINICPGATSTDLTLVDLFNLLDMHHQSGHGFPDREQTFLPPQRVIGARGGLSLLIQTLLYVDWHAKARVSDHLQHHQDFATELGIRMQKEGRRIGAQGGPDDFELDKFIVGDVDFVSLNWDPIGLWTQFVANRCLNGAPNVPRVGSSSYKLALYHDLGYFVSGPRIDKTHVGSKVWQPMNIASARQLNDRKHGAKLRIRVSKYLFPHGCLWWRECPNCGKLSSYIGDLWETDSASLFPPPPLKAFVNESQFRSWCVEDDERSKWRLGEVDARACVHCKTLTHAHHTPVVMQTSFKSAPPPFLEEIQRDMRVLVQEADHIVLAGYSLPPDDVSYRSFFSARTRKSGNGLNNSVPPVRCSVIDLHNRYGNQWLYPDEIQVQDNGWFPEVLKNAQDIFGPENVRFFGGGIPSVFLGDGTRVSARAVERLFVWDKP